MQQQNVTSTKNVPMREILNTNSSGKSYTVNEDSTIGLVSDDDEILSFDRSVINNQDFLLSSSFNNMYKKNGLHIEEGRVGRLVCILYFLISFLGCILFFNCFDLLCEKILGCPCKKRQSKNQQCSD